jgi:UDP-N-acetyl-2-amino-2-deoxyglucuronate dehydrogenase
MNTLRIGIAGCGKVAHLHARAIGQLENTGLEAVWSRSTESAARFAGQYGTRHYARIAEMVEREDLDAVIICTPHPFHVQPAVEAMEAGAHVLIEKPLASTLDDCDRILAAASALRRKTGVISQRRWYPGVQRLKSALEAGRIGAPALGTVQMLGWRDRAYYESDAWRGTWAEEGGGVLVNQAPHQLDLLLWFMGEVEELVGCWDNLNHPFIEVEDTALAIVRFKNGGLGNILVSNSQKPGLFGKVHVHGRNGASLGVQTESGAMFIAGSTGIPDPPLLDLWTVPGEEGLRESWNREDAAYFTSVDPTVHFIGLQIADFLAAIGGAGQPAVTGGDGRRVVELFTAIYRSRREKGWMRFPLKPEPGLSDMDGRLS